MYRIVIVCIALISVAACDHGGGLGMDFAADPEISADVSMEEITVIEYGAVSPEHIVQRVTIDAGRGIERTVELYADFDLLAGSCEGIAELSEEDFESVRAVVAAADLSNYLPPASDSCEQLIGTQGVGFVYTTADGGEFSFDSGPCILEEKIEDIRTLVEQLADEYIADCTPDGFIEA